MEPSTLVILSLGWNPSTIPSCPAGTVGQFPSGTPRLASAARGCCTQMTRPAAWCPWHGRSGLGEELELPALPHAACQAVPADSTHCHREDGVPLGSAGPGPREAFTAIPDVCRCYSVPPASDCLCPGALPAHAWVLSAARGAEALPPLPQSVCTGGRGVLLPPLKQPVGSCG